MATKNSIFCTLSNEEYDEAGLEIEHCIGLAGILIHELGDDQTVEEGTALSLLMERLKKVEAILDAASQRHARRAQTGAARS